MSLQATNYKPQASHGYTLVEAIIYVAILAGLAVVFISLLFTMTRSYAQFRLERDIASSASLGLGRLVREARSAASVDPASVLGSHPGRLRLNTTDENGLAITLDFYLSAGALMVKEGDSQAASTTAKNVTVDNLIFYQINLANSSAIKIEMTLVAARGATARTQKFYDTAVLRGSY